MNGNLPCTACGVYVPGVWSTYAYVDRFEPTTPKIEDCTCSTSVGMLMPKRTQHGWKLTPNDSSSVDIATARDMRSMVESVMLPFLNKFHSSLEVANFLSSDLGKQYKYINPRAKTKRFSYSAIIHFNFGNKEKAIRLLDEAIEHETSKKSPLEWVVNDLKDLKSRRLRLETSV